jgi:hypothetical protein
MSQGEFVMIPVPVDRVQEVYEVLGRPKQTSPLTAATETPKAPNGYVNGTISWPEDLLRRCYRESPPVMTVVFEHLATNAGREVTSAELAEAVGTGIGEPGYERAQLAGVLGAFGRRWKNRYERGGRHDGAWPFRAEWSAEHEMFVYEMNTDVAKVFDKFIAEKSTG